MRAVRVSGSVADNAPELENPVPVAGKAVTAAGYAPAFTASDRAALAVDKTTGGLLVQAHGSVAHDAVDDAANPVKIGGLARTTFNAIPTPVATGDRVSALLDLYGRQQVVPSFKDPFTFFASAARTATPTASSGTNTAARGVIIYCNVSAIAPTGSLVLTFDGQDSVSSAFYNIITSASITATGLYVLRVFPSITPVANVAVSDLMPLVWRLAPTHGNGVSITYSVSGVFLL